MPNVRIPNIFSPPLSQNAISSSLPIKDGDIKAIGNGANFLIGRGQVLVPPISFRSGAIGPFTTTKEYVTRFWFNPKKEILERTWNIGFWLTGAGGFAITGTLTCSIDGALSQSVNIAFSGPGAYTQRFVFLQSVTGSRFTTTGSDNLFKFTWNGGTGTQAFVSLIGYNVFENSRAIMSTTDKVADLTQFAAFQPISTQFAGIEYGPPTIAVAISQSQFAMRQACSFQDARPYSDGTNLTTFAIETISGTANQFPYAALPIPFQLRHLSGSISSNTTDNQLWISIFGFASATSVFTMTFCDKFGHSASLPISATSTPTWFTTSISPTIFTPVQTTAPLAQGQATINYLHMTGSRSSGSGNFTITTIAFGERFK